MPVLRLDDTGRNVAAQRVKLALAGVIDKGPIENPDFVGVIRRGRRG